MFLTEALNRINMGLQRYACAAIQDVETDLRFLYKDNVVSKAAQIFQTYCPKGITDEFKSIQGWWPKGDQKRIDALNDAIKLALKRND